MRSPGEEQLLGPRPRGGRTSSKQWFSAEFDEFGSASAVYRLRLVTSPNVDPSPAVASHIGRSTAVGLTFALLSSAAFGTSGTFARSLLDVGWSPGAAVLLRVAIAAVVLTAIVAPLLSRHRLHLRRNGRTLLVYGVAAVAGAQLCYFNAVEHLSVAVALLLEYSGTLLVVLWMWVRHAHRPNWLTVTGAVAAIGGLALVLDVFGDVSLDVIGVLWGLGAALGLATYFVISASTDDALPPLLTAWGGLVVGGIALGVASASGAVPFRAVADDVTLLDRQVTWVVPLLGMSIVAAAFSYVAGIAGSRILGAKVASFVGLTEVLFAVLFAWVAVDESLSAGQLAGGALVVLGIALVKVDDNRGDAALSGTPATTMVTGATPVANRALDQ
jgi:drug/metabolite transporter (DMT)-like permease